MDIFQQIFSSLYVIAFLASLFTYIFSTKLLLYPVIISVADRKGLMDEPGERSAHVNKVPRLGGLGMFVSFSLSIIVVALLVGFGYSELIKLLSLIGSLIILVFLGVKDDLVWMSPLKKLIGQMVAAANVVILTNVRISSMEGLIGIGELPYTISVIFSIFVFLLVINATNLIDGIDGLAGVIAIVASTTFGVYFLINDHYMMTLVSFVLIASILGFLKYNFRKSYYKIFMGDCGSMFLGFLLAYQGISFLSINNGMSTFFIPNAPIVLLAILSYPLLDTLRVFIIRIKQKRSPFSADHNHIHHKFLNIGLTHVQATVLLSICSTFVIGVAIISSELNINIQLFIIVGTGLLVYLFPFYSTFDNAYLNARNNYFDSKQHVASQKNKPNDVIDLPDEPLTHSTRRFGLNGEIPSSNVEEIRPIGFPTDNLGENRKHELNAIEQKQRITDKRLAELKKTTKKIDKI
jgi:UDP-N-acetylmuramyl pentapeptide phosphotransferase/UDP-N-acetylglucosamine-1-phosphate transferase